MLTLRPASTEECEVLTDLCMRSKALWGYDERFMETCRRELTLTAETLKRSAVQVAEIDGRIVGMAEITVTDEVATLEKLFVDPTVLRMGTGRELFDWAKLTAIALHVKTLTIESDPQAVDFYHCMGAIDDGTVASTSIAGRCIPKLKLTL